MDEYVGFPFSLNTMVNPIRSSPLSVGCIGNPGTLGDFGLDKAWVVGKIMFSCSWSCEFRRSGNPTPECTARVSMNEPALLLISSRTPDPTM